MAHARLVTLLSASYSTTSVALTWLWHVLAERPAIQDAIAAEFAASPGRSPLLARVFQETLRLHPPGWSLIPRQAIDDVELSGVRIRAGTMLGLYPSVVQRDPRLYPDPERFDPDRFLGAGPAPGAYFPFGLGPHTCVGMRLAQAVVSTIVESVLARARMSLSGPPARMVEQGAMLVPDRPVMVTLG